MKKNLLLFMCLILIGTVNAQPQQLRKWGLAPYYYDFTVSSGSSWKDLPHSASCGTAAFNGKPSTVVYDNSGAPVFFVVGDYIVLPGDSCESLPIPLDNTSGGGNGSQHLTNIGVFPIDDNCEGYLLVYNKYETFKPTQINAILYCIYYPATNTFETGLPRGADHNIGQIVSHQGSGQQQESPFAFAVSNYNNSTSSFYGGKVGRVILYTDGTTLSAASLKFTSVSGHIQVEQHNNDIDFFTGTGWAPYTISNAQELFGEMEVKIINGQGSSCAPFYRIAFSSFVYPSSQGSNYANKEKKVVVVDVDYKTVMEPSNAALNTKFFDVSTALDDAIHFKGLEFSPDAKTLYVTHTGANPVQYINNLNYNLNAVTGSTPSTPRLLSNVANFPNPTAFELSSIEIGGDAAGKLYFVNGNELLAMANPNGTGHSYVHIPFPNGGTFEYEDYNDPVYGNTDQIWLYMFPKKIDDQDLVSAPLTISGAAQACDFKSVYSVANPKSTVDYEWTVTGADTIVYIGNCNNDVIEVTWAADPDCPNRSLGGTVQAHAVGFCSLSNSNIINVAPCCDRMTHDFLYYNTTFNTLTFNNKTIVIEGSNNIVPAGQTVIFKNCTVLMGPDAQVTNNGNIQIDNCTVKAGCCEMWASFYNKTGSTISVTKSTVQDGLAAIRITDGAFYTIDNNVFNVNGTSILIEDYKAPYNSTISKCTFTCKDAANNPGRIQLSPMIGQISNYGIYVNNTVLTPYSGSRTDLEIGVQGKTVYNTFKYIQFGLLCNNSHVYSINNRFENLRSDNTALNNKGNGIISLTTKSNFRSKLLVGGGTNNFYRNIFKDCFAGIDTYKDHEVRIQKNSFMNNRYGISSGINVDPVIDINTNEFNDNQYGVYLYKLIVSKSTPQVLVQDNILDNPSTNGVSDNIGIWVLNTTKNSLTENIQITGNTIKKYERGVYGINLKHPTVSGNTITEMRHSANDTDLVEGIVLHSSINPEIKSNYIDGNYPPTTPIWDYYWTAGIRVDVCDQAIVECNHTGNIANGIFMSGVCESSQIVHNYMVNNYTGFVLSGTTGGQLGTTDGTNVGQKAGNTWGGVFNYHTYVYNADGRLNDWYLPSTATSTGTAANPTPSKLPSPMFNDANIGSHPIDIIPYGDDITLEVTSSCSPELAPVTGNGNGTVPFNRGQAHKIAQGEVIPIIYEEPTLWLEKMALDGMLERDPSLITGDAILEQFNQLMQASITRKLRSIDGQAMYAKEDALLEQQLSSELATISPTNDLEQMWVTTLEAEIALSPLRAATMETMVARTAEDSIRENMIDQLRLIAASCPYEFGVAVYNARALLYTLDTGIVHYHNPCEDVIYPDATVQRRVGNSADKLTEEKITVISAENGIRIFPNPAKDKLIITGIPNLTYSAEIFNTNGMLVSKTSINGLGSIDVNNLSNGMYLLKLTDNEYKAQYLKFVVNH